MGHFSTDRFGSRPEPANCPTCGGTGYDSEMVCLDGACVRRLIPAWTCQDCRGSGKVTDETTRRYLDCVAQHPDDPF